MSIFLLADDSPEKIHLLRNFLQQAHWNGEILVAETTEKAIAMIDAHPEISAAFIDYYIPLKNGPSVIRYLKKNIPTTRIALVSSADNPKNSAEARDAGAEAVVCTSHPVDMVEKSLSELLGSWKNDAS